MSAATQPRRRAHVSPRHAIRHTLVIVRRNLLRIVRLPQLLLFATVQPVMFLILFNYVFGGAVGRAIPAAAGGQYLNWLVPGLLLQVAAFGSTQTSMGLIEDLNNGVIDRFRSLPMARSAVLAGRTIADLIRNGFVIGLMVVLGYALGFRPQTSLVPLAGALLLALAFAFALSWVMAAIGLTVKNSEVGAVGRLHTYLSAGVCQFDIRTDRYAARLAARVRRPSAGNPHRQRRARPDPRRGRAGPLADGRGRGHRRPAVGARHPRAGRAAGRTPLPPLGKLTVASHSRDACRHHEFRVARRACR